MYASVPATTPSSRTRSGTAADVGATFRLKCPRQAEVEHHTPAISVEAYCWAMFAIVAVIVMAAVLFWLFRQNAADIDAAASTLGLRRAATRVTTRGTSAEGFAYVETTLLEGTIAGTPAALSVRTVKRRQNKYRRHGSEMTVLTLRPGRPMVLRVRLQPAGMLESLEWLQKGEPPETVPTGDPAFDAAYRLYASDAAVARAVLTTDLRRDILALRERVAGPMPSGAASGMAAGLLLGTFDVEPDAARYVVYGSPTAAVAAHVHAAVPLLLRLAGRPTTDAEPVRP